MVQRACYTEMHNENINSTHYPQGVIDLHGTQGARALGENAGLHFGNSKQVRTVAATVLTIHIRIQFPDSVGKDT